MPHRNPLQPVTLTKPSAQPSKTSQACAEQPPADSNTTTFLHLPHRLSNSHDMDQNLTYYNSRRQRRPVSDTASRQAAAQQSGLPSRSHSSAVLHHQSSSSARRSRQPIACDPCRASKRKCSGGQPCVSCLKRGGKVQCYYDKAAELKLVARQKTLAMTSRGQREATAYKKRVEANLGRAARTMERRVVNNRINPKRRVSNEVEHTAHASYDDGCEEQPSNDVEESEGDDAYMEVSSLEGCLHCCLKPSIDSGCWFFPLAKTVPVHSNDRLDPRQSWTSAGSHSAGYQRTHFRRGQESEEPVSTISYTRDRCWVYSTSSVCLHATAVQPLTPSPSRRRQSVSTRLSTASSQQSSVEKQAMSSPTTPSQQDRSPSQSSAFSGISSQRSEVSSYRAAGCQRLFGETLPSKTSEACGAGLLPHHLPPLRGSWALGGGVTNPPFGVDGRPRLPQPLRTLGSSNTIGFSCIGRPAFSKPLRFSTMEPSLENRAGAAVGLVGDGALLPSAREGNVPAWIKPYPYARPCLDPRANYGIGQWVRGGAPDVLSGHTLAPIIRPPYAPTSQHRSTTSTASSPAGPQTKQSASRASDSRMTLPPTVHHDGRLSLLGRRPSS